MGQKKLTTTNYTAEWPEFLSKVSAANTISDADAPIIVRMSDSKSEKLLEELVKNNSISSMIDEYDEQLAELLISRSPQLYKAPFKVKQASLKDLIKQHYDGTPTWQLGSWVYYPWSKTLVHVLEEDLFKEARTIRNKNLITSDEQQKFADFKVGFAGMSVGSNAVIATSIMGGSQSIRLADSAVISASNLNRIITGVSSVGLTKSLVISRKIYEMNPYLRVERFKDNITKSNISKFFDGKEPLRAVVDEIDNLEIKIALRVVARKRRIPVIMVTELGDDLMLDVERFDLNPSIPLFHGLVGNIEEEIQNRELTSREWLKYATSIINTKNVPVRMQKSLLQVGTKIVTHPQLGGTAMMVGGVVGYTLRKIALGEPIKSGRTKISLDKELLSGARSITSKIEHRKHTRKVQKSLNSI